MDDWGYEYMLGTDMSGRWNVHARIIVLSTEYRVWGAQTMGGICYRVYNQWVRYSMGVTGD